MAMRLQTRFTLFSVVALIAALIVQAMCLYIYVVLGEYPPSSEMTRVRFLVNIINFVGLLNLILAIVIPLANRTSIFNPLTRMMQAMHEIANGHPEVNIPYTDHADEMGEMAKTAQVFKDNSQRMIQMAAEQKMREQIAAEQKRGAMRELAAQFEANVKNVVDMVAEAANEMDANSKSVSKMAEASGEKLSGLTGQIEGATRNVQVVSTATTQLSSAVNEITQQVSRATHITATAVQEADQADSTVNSLNEAAQKIGEVLGLINTITGQINLLALNATIEAARAGDAGKGFAVVASEVKSLANQTSKATEEISQYIASIQAATGNTVKAIKNITHTIHEINEISTTIAAAVEEQGVATKDIAHNVQEAADGTSAVARNAGEVSTTSRETGAAATEMMTASAELSHQAETLRREVGKFLDGIRKS